MPKEFDLADIFLLQFLKISVQFRASGWIDALFALPTRGVFTKNSLGPQWNGHVSYFNRKTKQYTIEFHQSLVSCGLFICLSASILVKIIQGNNVR